jgi:replicative DNA helicase
VQQIVSGAIKDSEKETINTLLYTLSKAEIYVDDTPSLVKKDFHKRCKQLKNKYGADIIFVDGLELLSFPELSDIEEDTKEPHYVLNDIKKVSKELELPIVVFSHLANTSTFDGKTVPTIKNVYDFIPEIADSVYLIHRQNAEEKADIVIAQHPTIKKPIVVSLKFIESIDKFVDFSE